MSSKLRGRAIGLILCLGMFLTAGRAFGVSTVTRLEAEADTLRNGDTVTLIGRKVSVTQYSNMHFAIRHAAADSSFSLGFFGAPDSMQPGRQLTMIEDGDVSSFAGQATTEGIYFADASYDGGTGYGHCDDGGTGSVWYALSSGSCPSDPGFYTHTTPSEDLFCSGYTLCCAASITYQGSDLSSAYGRQYDGFDSVSCP